MLHAGIEALFGRNRENHQRKHNFRLYRRHSTCKNQQDDLTKFFLDKPQLDKTLIHGTIFAFAAMQGWRSTMEDKHKHLIPFDRHSWKSWTYFAIFDGHNGIGTAKNASDKLDIHLLNTLNQMLYKLKSNSYVCSSEIFHHAIKQAYFQLDKDLEKLVKDGSGCVCITSLIGPEMIYLINIGDARGIIISNDGTVLAHTEDHKPDDPAERERIYEAGGRISKSCAGDVLRVENHLAMTRVLGDFSIDKQIVPAMADIIQYPRNSLASFIILACDGIWDVMSNSEVGLFVAQHASTYKLEEISSLLLDECLRRNSTDNMSVYIIKV